jgi:hypothetical protein
MWWLLIGILLALAVLWLLAGYVGYQEVFADEHLREVAARLPALKRAALERVIAPGADAACTPEDPRAMRTSVGLAVLYLVGREGDWFHHHLSVSLPDRRYTAHAVGDLFLWLLARLLGVGMDRLRLGISRRTVHHAVFTLSAEEHERFAARPVAPLSPEELSAFRREWARSWRTVGWERLP